MTTNPLPISLFESLLPKLVTILEVTQSPDGAVTPQAKQALLQATNDFKNAMNQAKELALALPGGELLIHEQDEVIDMLVKLRKRKIEQLSQFSSQLLRSSSGPGEDIKMEIDSTASTPCND